MEQGPPAADTEPQAAPQPASLTKVLDDPMLSRLLKDQQGTTTRQALIKAVERKTRRRLVTYVSLIGSAAMISPDDIIPLTDVLQSVPEDVPLDVLLNSPGGLPDVADKMLQMLRAKRSQLRFVVPNYAKSAATLMVLGGDEIVMSDTSELGPIDPQVPRQGALYVPAHAVVDSFTKLRDEVNARGQLLPADVPILTQIDLPFIQYCAQAIAGACSLATRYLQTSMLKSDPERAAAIADRLANERGSHGRVINWQEAQNDLGLCVQYRGRSDALWRKMWELYCRSELMLRNTQQVKLFESSTVSLAMKVTG